MSDLISRSELLKEVEKYKFGAISNDAEREYIKKTILDFIICQPTAYSVDKVVEELENASWEETDISTVIYIDDAIEIVKHGGVSDDVCEWKKSKDYPFDWLVGCDGCEVNHRQGDYCPRCGKKIKLVE